MARGKIDDEHVKAIFVELAATRMLLRVLLEAVLPPEQDKAWEEINGLVARIDDLAKHSVIGRAEPESSRQIVDGAAKIAKAFALSIGPKPPKQ